jgi:hypothetical protein
MQERCRLISESQWREYQECVQKMHQLEELSQEGNELNAKLVGEYLELEDRLKEAEKVIKFYADAQPLTEEEKQMSAEKYHLVYGLKANDYLEKYGVKK